MLITGTIKTLDSTNSVINTWKLKNVQDINGHAMLYNQSESGLYAKVVDGVIYIEELTPKLVKPGIPMISVTLVDKSNNWIHTEEL